jgi:SOS-response transcriptional repressor LexA
MSVAERIKQARQALGLSQGEFGRLAGTEGKSAVSQWERGVTEPGGDSLLNLRRKTNLNDVWVREGRGQMFLPAPTARLVGKVYHVPNVAEAGATYGGKVPLISSVQAGNWREVIDNLPPGVGEDWVSTTAPVKDHTYALRVTGDSMEPEFPEGMILIVEPELEPQAGDFVIVRLDGDVTFKQLVQDSGEWYLKPLNPRYPIRALPVGATFCGVVREANRRYR